MKNRIKIQKSMIYATVGLMIGILTISYVVGYCLTGVRWPDNNNPADVYYNLKNKVTTGQCISSSQMDSAVTSGITTWGAIRYAGTTTKTANKQDGQNTVGWAKLGGQTLGITNYLSYDKWKTVLCNGNYFANLYEADVRISTAWRWTSNSGQCPCSAGSAIYLNSVSAHEFGHVIGLCHVSQASALMSPSVGVCENKNKTSDETAGENAIYNCH